MSGTRARFDDLFRGHYGHVVRWVRALGVLPGDVDDVAQEVFMIAHRRLDQLRPGASARAWLFSIARGVCANHRRGRAREEARREHASVPSRVPDPEQAAGRRQGAAILQRFLDDLPDEQRVVFILYDMEGMKAPEVGETLGIPPELVHSRLRGARDKLRRTVDAYRAQTKGVDRA